MIVVDTNVVAYLYLPGAYTARAEDLLQRVPEWAAPVLWRSEFRNILAGCMRRRALSFEQARQMQAEGEDPSLVPSSKQFPACAGAGAGQRLFCL